MDAGSRKFTGDQFSVSERIEIERAVSVGYVLGIVYVLSNMGDAWSGPDRDYASGSTAKTIYAGDVCVGVESHSNTGGASLHQ